LRVDWSAEALDQFVETQTCWRYTKSNPEFARRIADAVANGVRRLLDYPSVFGS
jgi:hypothetical protein